MSSSSIHMATFLAWTFQPWKEPYIRLMHPELFMTCVMFGLTASFLLKEAWLFRGQAMLKAILLAVLLTCPLYLVRQTYAVPDQFRQDKWFTGFERLYKQDNKILFWDYCPDDFVTANRVPDGWVRPGQKAETLYSELVWRNFEIRYGNVDRVKTDSIKEINRIAQTGGYAYIISSVKLPGPLFTEQTEARLWCDFWCYRINR